MSTKNLKEALAALKNVKAEAIQNIDLNANTFELGANIYSFDLTKSGKQIKTGSVKYFTTKAAYQNCSY